MNIKSTNLDEKLPADAGVGPKVEPVDDDAPPPELGVTATGEFSNLPTFAWMRPAAEMHEPIPTVKLVNDYWIADADGDLVRRSHIIAMRVDRHEGQYRVVGVTDRMVFTFGTFMSTTAAMEFRLQLAAVVAGRQ